MTGWMIPFMMRSIHRSKNGVFMKKINLIGIILLILSVVLITIGAYTGKVKETERKGNTICLECIGLG